MNSKQRMIAALDGKTPDRLPVTTHHVMEYFLNKYMGGMDTQAFFDHFKFDPITWTLPYKADESKGHYLVKKDDDSWEDASVQSNDWRIEEEDIPGQEYETTRYSIVTPKGTLTALMQSNDQTSWLVEHLIKQKSDIDLITEYAPNFFCDVNAVNKVAADFGDRGLVRGHIPCFDIYGQPGCWQDFCCLIGTEEAILATYDDPQWVHTVLGVLQKRKQAFIESLAGANYDVLELGGGSASTTVISPKIFEQFVAPYDAPLIEKAHEAGQRIAYHTCGGMMPILEQIAAMKPDAMETFTPVAMGADVDLAEAKRRIGDDVCIIGGFDQFHFFDGCTPEETRAEVRRCFDAAGGNGGYILCPSDHFFDADPALLEAFVDEAQKCVY
jgi:uroporphyrinogen decarboxylase